MRVDLPREPESSRRQRRLRVTQSKVEASSRGAVQRIAVLTVFSLAVAGLCPAAAPLPSDVTIQVLSRTLQPGELVRIVVSGSAALDNVRGRWLEQPLSFAPVDNRRQIWSAWAAVPLDARAGNTAAEIDATYVDGRNVHRSHPLLIRSKRFPEERLSVAPRFAEPPPEVQQRLTEERAFLASVYARRTVPASNLTTFVRPVPGDASSIFGKRRVFNGKPRDPHPGLDLRAATGTPVRCSAAGTVVVARELYYSGNTVIVDHGGGLFTVYAHLSRLDVVEDAPIASAAVLGLSGATGRVTGPHLHWGAKVGAIPFDPTALLDPRLFPSL